MLVGAALLACLVSVPLTGGRAGALAQLRFERVGAIVAAIALQVLVVSVIPGGSPLAHRVLHLASYALAALFVWANRRLPGLILIAAGGAANLAAIAANGGVMPASSGALRTAGLASPDGRFLNSAAVAHPHLQVLGDVFAVPSALPLANVFSVGDVLLVAGAAVLVHAAARRDGAQRAVIAGPAAPRNSTR